MLNHEIARRLHELACACDDSASATSAKELEEQVARNELNVLVVGQFKRGKSSLINALLGADVMPTGALPLTGVVTAIRYGDTPRIDVCFETEPIRSIAADELATYVTELNNPANIRRVRRVDVFWPSTLIQGLALFDTPGIGSTYSHNTAAAHAALPKADAAILVVGPDPPIGADELAYVQRVVASSEQLFVVLNKSDIAGEALPEILRFTQLTVEQSVETGSVVEIIPLSATLTRNDQRAGRENDAFGHLVAALRDFVARKGDITLERSIRRRAGAILQRLQAFLAMRIKALRLPALERSERRKSAERALEAVDDRVRTLELMINDDVRQLQRLLEEQLDRSLERDEPSFVALAAGISKEPSSERRAQTVEMLLAERSAIWRNEVAEIASSRLLANAARYSRLLGEIEVATIAAGCEALQVDSEALVPRVVEFAPPRLSLVATAVPTTGLEIIIASATDVLPARLRRRVLEKRYSQTLALALDALRGKLRYGISRDLEPWRSATLTTIASSIEGTRSAVLAAFTGSGDGADDAVAIAALNATEKLRAEAEAMQAELKKSSFGETAAAS